MKGRHLAVKLRAFFKNQHKGYWNPNPTILRNLASIFAFYERMWEATESGKQLDTSRLDHLYLIHRPGVDNDELIKRIHRITHDGGIFKREDYEKKEGKMRAALVQRGKTWSVVISTNGDNGKLKKNECLLV